MEDSVYHSVKATSITIAHAFLLCNNAPSSLKHLLDLSVSAAVRNQIAIPHLHSTIMCMGITVANLDLQTHHSSTNPSFQTFLFLWHNVVEFRAYMC